MNITEFLSARIAEDEVRARSLLDGTQGGYDINEYAERMIAECAAKLAILELHDALEDKGWKSGKDHDYLWCGSCGTLDDAPVPYPCETLEALAAVYKEHPDHNPAWTTNAV